MVGAETTLVHRQNVSFSYSHSSNFDPFEIRLNGEAAQEPKPNPTVLHLAAVMPVAAN